MITRFAQHLKNADHGVPSSNERSSAQLTDLRRFSFSSSDVRSTFPQGRVETLVSFFPLRFRPFPVPSSSLLSTPHTPQINQIQDKQGVEINDD